MNGRLVAALAKVHASIPSFARQTGLACSVCHYQFPALTPFGRMFKLNGYTMTGLPAIVAPSDTASNPSLKLLTVPPISAMFVGSMTRTDKAVPGTQNNVAEFPSVASLYIGGAITPNVGLFSQFTYTPSDGAFGLDMIDLRYTSHHDIDGHDLLLGFTLHNMPTVQDVWNTLPAYSVPYMSSEVAPGAMASTLLEGQIGMVTGLGAYTLLDNQIYSELTVYRSTPQGGASMGGMSSAMNTTEGVAPYWRIGWQHQLSSDYLMIGTFGLHAQLYPAGITGPTNQFTDVGFDAQYEHPTGAGAIIGHAAWTHESQKRTADVLATPAMAEFQNDYLSTFKADVSLATSLKYGASLGFFQTSGSTDAMLYQPGAVDGSTTGSPNTQGLIGEVSYSMWQNTRLGLQYVAYSRFNGSSTNYDGAGRSARDNNTLYTYIWLAF
ncbi:MAG TPA: hypothetical protein VMV51_04250 [Gemmatimonadaceae bacterium]|nr:hypothetical protein [Gemmatimonadaceae bacterium]